MADSPLRAKGRAMRRKLMGDAYADKLDSSLYTDPIMEKFAEVTQETIFGTLWTRPGLSPHLHHLGHRDGSHTGAKTAHPIRA